MKRIFPLCLIVAVLLANSIHSPIEAEPDSDSIKPIINTSIPCYPPRLMKGAEHICIHQSKIKDLAPGMVQVPIKGSVLGKLMLLTVDGKEIALTSDNFEFSQEISLQLHHGLNKFEVVAEDVAGNRNATFILIEVLHN